MSGSAARTGRAGDRRDPRRGQGKGGRTRRRRRDGVRHRPQHAGVASRLNRPETIEDTAELVTKAGGQGIAVRCDHLVPSEVEALAQRIEHEQHGRLDVLVDDTWGGDQWIEWRPIWEHDLDKGLRALRNGLETHLITLQRCCRCWCSAAGAWSWRSPTATTPSTSATGARCSST